MAEIPVLSRAPIIFTKDQTWIKEHAISIKLKEGAIILLPEDAVLYEPPTVLCINTD